jgi:ATP-binding protein involved in chromosome partitioning
MNIPILGIVENMSGFVCPCCGEETDIFTNGKTEVLCKEFNIDFLGRIPLDPV